METTPDSTETSPAAAAVAESASAPGWVNPDGSWQDGVFDRLPEDLKSARPTIERYPNLPEFIKSHISLRQRLGRGADGVFVPDEKSSPEEVAAYRAALGVPEKPDDYQIRPEQLPEGVEWNDEAVKPFLELAHRHNIPEKAMRELVQMDAQREQARIAAMSEIAQQELAQGQQMLKRTWGASYDKNISRAQQAASLAGIDVKSPGFVDPQVVMAFARLGEMVSEDKLVQAGGGGTLQLAGKSHARDIQTNPDNPRYKKYQEGDRETVNYVRNLLRQG